jgi:hypothetical protein
MIAALAKGSVIPKAFVDAQWSIHVVKNMPQQSEWYDI